LVVYGIRRSVEGKIYVGQTAVPLSKRIWKHVWLAKHDSPLPIHRAIRKYGIDSFEIVTLAVASSAEELNRLEKQYIADFRSNEKSHGYNLTDGGDGKAGYRLSERTKAKIGAANRGRVWSEEQRQRVRQVRLGKRASAETKARMSAAQKAIGNKPPVGSHAGHSHSEETKNEIAVKLRAYFKNNGTERQSLMLQKARHQRWHVKRNIVSTECRLCLRRDL
jgi:group I intron endonuclease